MAATKSNNSTILYIIIGLLVAVVAYFLYKMYQDDKAATQAQAAVEPLAPIKNETPAPAPAEVMPTAPAPSGAEAGIPNWRLKIYGLA